MCLWGDHFSGDRVNVNLHVRIMLLRIQKMQTHHLLLMHQPYAQANMSSSTDVNKSNTRSSSESSLEAQRKKKVRHREAQKRYRLARVERETTEQRQKRLDRKRQ